MSKQIPKLTRFQSRVLYLLSGLDHPIYPREFSELVWPDNESHGRTSNAGHGAVYGAGIHRKAGAVLCDLRRRGLVHEIYPHRGGSFFYYISQLGRDAVATDLKR